MTPLHRLFKGAAIGVALAAISACAAGAGPAGSSGERVEGGTITYAHYQEPDCIWGGWVQQAYLSRQVFDSLVSYDNGQILPWLATSWSISEDRKTVSFDVRDDVTFTDGTPFDAAAVKANVDFWLENLPWVDYSYLLGATVTGDYTVDIQLSEPNPELFNELANGHYGIQSPTALSTRSESENCQTPIGSGPFTVEKWDRGQGISFVRNDSYSSAPPNAKHDGPAHVERLEWKFVADATTRWGSLTTGQADAVYDIPSAQWSTANDQYEVLDYVATGRPQALSFNTQVGPFTDQHVRQAFVYASDRRKIVETIFNGSVPFEGNGTLSVSTPDYLDVDDAYPYDVDKANELLDEAGWSERNGDGYRVRDGEVLEITFPYMAGRIVTPEGGIVLQTIQDQVKAAGFKVDLIPMTPTQVTSGAYSKPEEKDLSFGYWVWPAPGILDINFRAATPDRPNGNNTTFFADPEVEARIIDAQREADPATRTQKYAALQQYFTDQAIAIGVYNYTVNVTLAPNLKDVWQDTGNGLPVFSDAYFVE